jgi:hypothetical protein
MKALTIQQMEATQGGDIIVGFCAGVGLVRGGAVLLGLAGVSVATGGTAVLVVAAACSIYGAGRAFDWW